ncbi:MAG: hypothetical protein QNJ98_04825 [Planctomycetota bacterium]|nr:hypothetical protein [Planctomycetota bacterium]
MKSWLRHAALLLLFVSVGCGGGGGTGDAGAGTVPGPTPNPGPQVALLVCSGFSPFDPNYLEASTGPQLVAAIQGAGYSLEASYFADDLGGGAEPGYTDLVAKLEQIRDDWIVGQSNPTQIVIVSHSYGCVRSHAAVRAVPDCPVRMMVDLDGSSVGWTLLTHPGDNPTQGGAPEGAYGINATIVCPAHPTVPSAPPPFDLEDVVFPNVEEAYEVRSGALIVNPANPFTLIEYDERWNARLDGSTTGLTCVFSGTDHSEVAQAGGTTLAGAQAWILARLP